MINIDVKHTVFLSLAKIIPMIKTLESYTIMRQSKHTGVKNIGHFKV